MGRLKTRRVLDSLCGFFIDRQTAYAIRPSNSAVLQIARTEKGSNRAVGNNSTAARR